jgi:hypothetical protein
MIEAAVCLFLLLFCGATYALFRFLARVCRHRPPSPQASASLAAWFSPLPAPAAPRLEPGEESMRTERPGEAP